MPVIVRKICQIGGFLLLASMLFCTMSVSSYAPSDPTWNLYMSKATLAVRNLGGVVGASLAEWLWLLFGSTIFLFIGMGGMLAWHLMWGRLAAVLNVLWRGSVVLITGGTATALLFGQRKILWGKFFAGGMTSDWCAQVMVTYLNKTGSYLVLATVVCLLFFIGREQLVLRKVGEGFALLGQSVLDSRQRLRRWGGRVQGLMIGWYNVPRRLCTAGCQWLQERLYHTLPWYAEFDEQEQPALEMQTVAAPAAVHIAQRQDSVMAPIVAQVVQRHDTVVPPAVAQVAQRHDKAAVPPLLLPRSVPHAGPRQQDNRGVALAASAPPGPKVPPERLAGEEVPSIELLEPAPPPQHSHALEDLEAQARFLEQKLREFGVEGEVVQVLPGPVITMYEFAPAAGVKVGKIVNLQDDLALVMRAISVRVVAPIPGKAVVGIEIPNRRRESVLLRDLLDADEFRTASSKLSMTLGKDILGKAVIIDLALIPHLLVAGATGSGKSVGLNSLLCSLLFHATPADVKLIMIDPKMLEFSVYEGIPHLLIPVVTNPKKAAVALRRVVEEMGRRYQLLAARGVRSIAQYNQAIAEEQRTGRAQMHRHGDVVDDESIPAEKLPYLVVIIDELSDLMMVSSREVEDSLMRIAQMARAAGIHLIVATQRPSVDVLTGVIKANFPARISFQVTSKVDSRTILDTNGAEKLLGRGDMLFLAPGTSKPQRVHGAYVSEAEISRLVEAWKEMERPCYDESFLEAGGEQAEVEHEGYDEKYDEAVALVTKTGQASISMLQRRLRVGYNRAARMIEIMEQEGVVGPADGVKPRTVLVRNTYDDM